MCLRHLADTHSSSATARSILSKSEILDAELLLTPKDVRVNNLGVNVDLLFWIWVLGNSMFSCYVGLKTVNYKAVCVCIVVHIYRLIPEVKQTTPCGTECKNPPLMQLRLDKEYLIVHY
jgi:hypothetical protein